MKLITMLVLVLVFGCGRDENADRRAAASARAQNGGTEGDTAAPSFTIETVAEGLMVPWGIAFAPDGRIFVTERPGSIRIIRDGKLQPEPWATLKVAATGEAGLMGIALAPDFERSRAVFVVATFSTPEGLVNRVIRFTERDGRGQDSVVVLDRIPSARFHAGDAIAFGPDGMLYIATGDAMTPSRAHDMKSLGGKILRLTPGGGVPADNPFPGSPVFASGLRNTQGITWDRETGQMFATDHGPSGFPNERFRRNHDELNAIVAGGDFGWPDVAGNSSSETSIPPLSDWDPAIAPSGLAMYTGTDFNRWRGSLFVGALRGAHLRRVSVERDTTGWLATSEEIVVEGIGRIRAVAMGPDGYLYFTTSNHDGRGSPVPNDDRLLRIVPASP
jgi:glucose/arabinose dehydrogenase